MVPAEKTGKFSRQKKKDIRAAAKNENRGLEDKQEKTKTAAEDITLW